jgi:hypothetical protein
LKSDLEKALILQVLILPNSINLDKYSNSGKFSPTQAKLSNSAKFTITQANLSNSGKLFRAGEFT